MMRMKRFLFLHLDVPSMLLLVLVASMFYRPIANVLFGWSQLLVQSVRLPAWAASLVSNITASIITIILVAIAGIAFFRWRYKSEIAGKYKACIVKENGDKEDWGQVVVTYNLLNNTFRTSLRRDDLVVNGHATLVGQRHLVGTYLEASKLTRRRFGAFLYSLSGEGNCFTGKILCFDPKNPTLDEPGVENVVWEQVN